MRISTIWWHHKNNFNYSAIDISCDIKTGLTHKKYSKAINNERVIRFKDLMSSIYTFN